jgi:aspartate-semialdehyde dehydrogenase
MPCGWCATGWFRARLEMPLPDDSLRVAIAGAASLRGQDLKTWMEESGFPAGEVRLFDEEPLAGTLTEVAGEAAVIQSVDEDSFKGLRFVFFAGSRAFARRHGPVAGRVGATVIDLTGGLAGLAGARPWIPRLDAVLTPPAVAANSEAGGEVYLAASAPAIVACSFCSAVAAFRPKRAVMNFLSPASERGQEGVKELSEQTVKLLSLQSIPQEVFDCQVAFNLLDRWGAGSAGKLADAREGIAREVREYLGGRVAIPAMSLIQAPVFYGQAFAAFAEFEKAVDPSALAARLEAAGFQMAGGDDPGPSNVSVAGEPNAVLSAAAPDGGVPHGYWFWGAADNYRLPVSNALQIAEKILAA